MTDRTITPSHTDRTRIEEVANAAGVSVATVSRALRGLPNVAESTRARVQRVAHELSYRADPAATRLATGRSRSVAVAVPMLSGWYFSHVVAGVEAVCAEAGYDTIVIGLGGGGHNLDHLVGPSSLQGRADGLVVVDVTPSARHIAALRDSGIEVVSVGPTIESVASVGIDDVAVGATAAAHLIELGHRQIGLIRGEVTDPFEFQVPLLRQHGFERVLAGHGITPDPHLYVDGSFTIEGGYNATIRLLDRPTPPTAVFALSDEMAFGALHAARDLRVAVPEAFSVIGVDDHDAAGVLGLTTVRQDVESHGARAARLILAAIEGRLPIAERCNEPTRLIVRGSTAPAA